MLSPWEVRGRAALKYPAGSVKVTTAEKSHAANMQCYPILRCRGLADWKHLQRFGTPIELYKQGGGCVACKSIVRVQRKRVAIPIQRVPRFA
jgi:hypothetical protein